MNPQEDQLCANLIEQVIKVSDDYIRSKTEGGRGTSRAASVVPRINNEIIALRQILLKGSDNSLFDSGTGPVSGSRAASIISKDNDDNNNYNELMELRKFLFQK